MQQRDDPAKRQHVDGMGPAILVGFPGHELSHHRRLASIVHEAQCPDLPFHTTRQLGDLLEFLRARLPFLLPVVFKAMAQVRVERVSGLQKMWFQPRRSCGEQKELPSV